MCCLHVYASSCRKRKLKGGAAFKNQQHAHTVKETHKRPGSHAKACRTSACVVLSHIRCMKSFARTAKVVCSSDPVHSSSRASDELLR